MGLSRDHALDVPCQAETATPRDTVGDLMGVGGVLSVSHRDPVRREVHGHSYEVVCWFDADGRDAVLLQQKLAVVLTAWDHTTLPDDLSRAENLGAAIMQVMDCVGVELRRPLERIFAKVGRCG